MSQIFRLQIAFIPKENDNKPKSANFLGFTLQAGGYTVDNTRKIVKEYRHTHNWGYVDDPKMLRS